MAWVLVRVALAGGCRRAFEQTTQKLLKGTCGKRFRVTCPGAITNAVHASPLVSLTSTEACVDSVSRIHLGLTCGSVSQWILTQPSTSSVPQCVPPPYNGVDTRLPGASEENIVCSSVLKKRRKKMTKHKYRKRRKKFRFLRRRHGR